MIFVSLALSFVQGKERQKEIVRERQRERASVGERVHYKVFFFSFFCMNEAEMKM